MSRAPKENLSSYGSQMSAPAPGKKHRLSRLLGGNRQDESREHHVRPSPVANPTDSAYGSSDNTQDIVQVENDGSIPNTKRSQNLALDKGTGEVFDEDTGDIVTVVTTTTTTTTTTTRGGGKPHQEMERDVQTTTHENPTGATTAHTSAAPTSYDSQSSYPRDSAYSSGAPDIPVRSSRRSGEYDSYNPASKHNFSYPSRAAPAVTPGPNPAPAGSGMPPEEVQLTKKSSRLSDLKAAAIGLHGVGETLRGTLNSEIDNRFPSRNKERAAAIRAQNEAVLERGRHEMSGIPRRDQHGNVIAQHEHGHHDTNKIVTPPQHGHDSSTNDLSSVSNMSTSDRNTNAADTSLNVPGYHPPRGTAVRTHSEAAPEAITGAPERIPTVRQSDHSGLNQSNNPVSPIAGSTTHIHDQNTDTTDATTAHNTALNSNKYQSTVPETSNYQADNTYGTNTHGTHSQVTGHNTTDPYTSDTHNTSQYGTDNRANESYGTSSYNTGNDTSNTFTSGQHNIGNDSNTYTSGQHNTGNIASNTFTPGQHNRGNDSNTYTSGHHDSGNDTSNTYTSGQHNTGNIGSNTYTPGQHNTGNDTSNTYTPGQHNTGYQTSDSQYNSNNQTSGYQGNTSQPGTNQYAATNNQNDFSSGTQPKKEGTISKLFKRKPVGGTGEVGSGTTETAEQKAERKKFF